MECYASKIQVYIAEWRECLVYLILLQIRQIAKTLAINKINLSSKDYLKLESKLCLCPDNCKISV